MNSKLDIKVVEYIREAAKSEQFATYLKNTLVELVKFNTAPDDDLYASASREKAFFDWVEREVRQIAGQEIAVERPAVDPRIADDPAYSPPGYAAGPGGQVPPAGQVYAGRTNLLIQVPGKGPQSRAAAILHAHADVVSPWFGPREAGSRVFGRGSCDNKAQIAVILAELKLLGELRQKLGYELANGFVIQLAIDEEIGGNGSLSLSMDTRFARLPVLMLESTDLVPYCAHRGAVYYRCRLSSRGLPNVGAVEMFPLVVYQLEKEGRRIKEETNAPLFTPDHVQTNHGVLGPYGKHPGSVCDHVALELIARSGAKPERMAMKMGEFFEDALAEYVKVYGDKTKVTDSATGKLKVARHFDIKVLPNATTQNFRIDIYGKSGHMAAVADCDSAITKAAYMLGGLLRIAPNFPNIKATGRFADGGGDDQEIVLEGGQGFTPSHRMADIQDRMAAAARRGVESYCKLRRFKFDEAMVQMSFDRLHNDAYADTPDSVPMQALKAAFAAMGSPWPQPVAWQTSCDARIYHHKGHPVAIFGAGRLEAAHGEDEYVDIPDLQKALAVSTLATLALT
ncbi:MAG: M20/M25/M40 family metallo-hydrolase [Phycisphaerae bacterium]|nr:M20/M25/M40 family metallo-hydrolase [Phycisphaerae bacterium]